MNFFELFWKSNRHFHTISVVAKKLRPAKLNHKSSHSDDVAVGSTCK
nr:MAG TPA: hypothetical protein [Caudoviricetes sp.]